jgi:hypothetical protein
LPSPVDSLGRQYEIVINWSDAPNQRYLGFWNYPVSDEDRGTGPLKINGVRAEFVLDFDSYFAKP